MPELPEVETVARGLRRLILKRKILKITVKNPRSVRPESPRKFERQVAGREIIKVGRIGKWICVRLTGDINLWIHLGMSGRFLWNQPDPHSRVVVDLEGPATLYFSDIRTFGRMMTGPANQSEPPGVTLGIDPIKHKLPPEYLHEQFRKRAVAIKDVLLNQEIVAGIGNIYATEILFDAKLHPLRPANSLSLKECERLARCTVSCLRRAIRYGGTTLADNVFLSLDGSAGGFEEHIRVYGKHGQSCPACGTVLERYVLHGRSGVFCPKCQS